MTSIKPAVEEPNAPCAVPLKEYTDAPCVCPTSTASVLYFSSVAHISMRWSSLYHCKRGMEVWGGGGGERAAG